MREVNKRPRRIPLTSEEVSHFVKLRKRRELVELIKFKRTRTFKFLNSWNVLSIFIYLELIFCYFGPCHYQTHYSYQVNAHMGNKHAENGKTIISDIDIYALDGVIYNLVIDDFIQVPPKFSSFKVGKDFILQKKLKAVLSSSSKSYRIFSASPVLFLSVFLSIICFAAYHFNLNENLFSLWGLFSLNSLTLLAILMF
jgi:hypothetical protein